MDEGEVMKEEEEKEKEKEEEEEEELLGYTHWSIEIDGHGDLCTFQKGVEKKRWKDEDK